MESNTLPENRIRLAYEIEKAGGGYVFVLYQRRPTSHLTRLGMAIDSELSTFRDEPTEGMRRVLEEHPEILPGNFSYELGEKGVRTRIILGEVKEDPECIMV